MQKHRSSETPASVLRPTTPVNIGQQTQRQRIIDAMIESCAEKTFAATTITDIVAHAHISRTTFYKHFEDKRACFDAAIAYCIEQLSETAAAAHDPDDAPADATRKATTAVLGALAERPGLAQLLTGDAIAVDPALSAQYRRATIPALEALWGDQGKSPEARVDPRLSFGQVQVLLLNQIAAGKANQLLELLPELVYLAVSPFGGHDEALRQSRLARANEVDGAKR
ncbi:MAG TPA: TetR/AcrR family transcriptional regulator [Solirubrobacterales bacterium]|nr:TetR/AcrR family transcriptional regulator [Solirubrobacterales bacterium]